MSIFEELVSLLKEKDLYISSAESCTGGLFSSEIVSIPGASDILSSSFVTYSEKAKTDILGVSPETIAKFGVVSENVAIEMARGVCKLSGSDIGVAVTGYAGPASSPEDDTAGTVCFAFCVKGKTVSSTRYFGDIGRNAVRNVAVFYMAETVISLISRLL